MSDITTRRAEEIRETRGVSWEYACVLAERERDARRGLSTIGDVRRRHTGHWFDPDTMRFFKTRLPAESTLLISGRYFVSSEDNSSPYYPGERRYTIREALSDGKVETVGEFHVYPSRKAAERVARALPHEYSAHLMRDVLNSETHNRTGWIRTAKQLAKYTGAPLEDCREVIAARAKIRRRERRAQA